MLNRFKFTESLFGYMPEHIHKDVYLKQLTVLIGPNGSGKSSIIKASEYLLKGKGKPENEVKTTFEVMPTSMTYVNSMFNFNSDNMLKKADLNRSGSSVNEFAHIINARFETSVMSEGQAMKYSVDEFINCMREIARELKEYSGNYTLLIDEMDSGMSTDNIHKLVKDLKYLLGYGMQIIITCNTYDMIYSFEEMWNIDFCYDVRSGKYVRFNSYEEYRKYIMEGSN